MGCCHSTPTTIVHTTHVHDAIQYVDDVEINVNDLYMNNTITTEDIFGRLIATEDTCSFAFSKKHIEYMVFGYIRKYNDKLLNIEGILYKIIEFAEVYFQWDSTMKSENIEILKNCSDTIIENTGSSDLWQVAVTNLLLNSGNPSFEFVILTDAATSNSWKIMVGVVPMEFNPRRSQKWLGSQNSWGYIAGTGDKCFATGKSVKYGKKYGEGDTIKCSLDFEARTIEFFKNDISMGIAFTNLNCAVKPAVSITGTGTKIQIYLC
eukprot:418637_1